MTSNRKPVAPAEPNDDAGLVHNYFDAPVAAQYDDPADPMFDPGLLDRTTAFLAEQAEGGPALEFAIGTGRVALPLAARGITVSGIEYSPAMVALLRAKAGGDDLPVTIGDMATTRLPGSFALVYLVFNSLPNLVTQERQVACFRNAAAHLRPGGRFVLEIGVPIVQHVPIGQTMHVFDRGARHVGIDEIDVVTQQMWSHHYSFDVSGESAGPSYRLDSVPFRYVWPSELDLMAQLAGLEKVGRWADWERHEFTATSTSHVSVWRRPG